MTRIWINRAGPSRIHAMNMLRDNPDSRPVEIYATRTNVKIPSLAFADFSDREPGSEVSDEEYAEFVVDFADCHKIDVVIPTSRMTAMAMAAGELKKVGCTVLTVTEEVARITESKSATYEAASAMDIPVPPWFRVSSWHTFADAVAELRGMGHQVCVKPDTGWAAGGFRILEDDALDLSGMLASQKPVISAEAYERALWRAERNGEHVPDLIVLPYLNDPEVSVDCLSTPEGSILASVARSKNGWYREFSDDPQLMKIAHTAVESFPLAYLSNVQVRYLNGEPVLLEINPRASAGLFHTAHAGINMYWEAVRLAVWGESGPIQARPGGRVAVIEQAVSVPALT